MERTLLTCPTREASSLWIRQTDAYRAVQQGNYFSLLSLSALGGGVMVGLFDSLFSEPRISQLALMIVFSSMLFSRKRLIITGGQ